MQFSKDRRTTEDGSTEYHWNWLWGEIYFTTKVVMDCDGWVNFGFFTFKGFTKSRGRNKWGYALCRTNGHYGDTNSTWKCFGISYWACEEGKETLIKNKHRIVHCSYIMKEIPWLIIYFSCLIIYVYSTDWQKSSWNCSKRDCRSWGYNYRSIC